MSEEKNKHLFETAPVLQAVVALEVPTVISQLITVVYNMADTFFIGQVGDPNQIAAASVCLPLFMLLTGMANLFGIGGSSLIARSLGKGDFDKVKRAAAFSIWTAASVALVYGILIYAFRSVLLPLVGSDSATYDFCCRYAFWTITLGAVPTVLSAALAHLVRAEGYSKEASIGIAIGGILNIFLDPIFISVLHMEITGAAVATLLSNIAALIYFVLIIRKKRGSIIMSLDPRCYAAKGGILREVILVGMPSAIMNICGVLSNIIMDRLMVSYSDEALAGVGIAKKVDLLTYAVATGLSQGVIPLIGYNYSAKNYKRMMASLKTTFALSFVVALTCTLFLLTGAHVIVRAFIDDAKTVMYGVLFQRIICVTGPVIPISMVIITMFQAVGQKTVPMLLSMLRKGGGDIPAMLVMNHLIGVNGIVWATPIADVISLIASIICFIPFWRKLQLRIKENEAEKAHTSDKASIE